MFSRNPFRSAIHLLQQPLFRKRFLYQRLGILSGVLVLSLGLQASAQTAAEFMYSGKLSEGEAVLKRRLAQDPDASEHFGLGMIQFLQAAEGVVQDLNRHGFMTERTFGPRRFGRLLPDEFLKIFPDTANPEVFDHQAFRNIVQNWIAGLERADETLAEIGDGPVKFHLQPSRVMIDPAGQDRPVRAGRLLQLMFEGNRQMNNAARTKQLLELKLAMDRGDVHWLRGYLHLQMALGELLLAMDFSSIIEVSAHRLFEKVDTPHSWLLKEQRDSIDRGLFVTGLAIADFVAGFSEALHLEIKEPERFKLASQHLAQTLVQAKLMWKEIRAETDNEQEWIPNPRQDGPLGVDVTPRMIQTWLATLDEFELILRGERLIPFWRFKLNGRSSDASGVNFKKVIDNPPAQLKMILWIQGTAATPYLEKGKITRLAEDDFLRDWGEAFGYNIGFALWFN